ncbi:MAG: endonuclease/exonuclease/phosphatase family protein [Bacteriovorax sp.]
MKNAFLFFSMLLLFTSSLRAQSSTIPSERSLKTMNVLTMNIHCFKDDWEFRLSHILTKLVEMSPDVMAFQEVCENPSTHEGQIEYIKNFLIQRNYPLKAIEAQYTHLAWDQYSEYILLISKQEVSAIDKGFLPPSLLQRGFIAFNISDRWFINTHLEFRADNAQYRKNQIEFLTNRFFNLAHLIMGDFNSSPESWEQNIFKKKDYRSFFPGPTQTGDDGNLDNKIDGFWFSPLFYSTINSHSGAILFKEKVQDKYLSDHFAVITQLKFNQ